MSTNDEFESLIRNFKLDDMEPPPGSGAAGRRAFDFDREEQQPSPRAAQATAPRPSAQQARSSAQQRQQMRTGHPQQRAVRPSRQGVAAPQYQQATAPQYPMQPQYPAPQTNPPQMQARRKEFQVQIDEDAYGPSGSPRSYPAMQPVRAAGGGGGGYGGGYDDEEDEDEYEGGGGGRWFKAIIALIVVLAVSVFLAFFALETASDLFGLNKAEGEVEFTLPAGLTTAEIAEKLQTEGIITQPLVFQIYADFKDDTAKYEPGNYTLNKNMGYDQIMMKFRTGSKILIEVRVLFYEGMTLSEMAQSLEEAEVCTADALYEYLNTADLSDYDFVAEIPRSADRFRKYEGYFFPDTYNFYKDMKPAQVVQRFFNYFYNRVIADEELTERLSAVGMSVDQAITLASVIQKEASNAEQMGNVSGVFHNRLAEGSQLPQLQSDVTRDYVNNYIKPFLDDAVDKESNPDAVDPNQAMYDAYNTYVCKGLPVGPVCNPGLEAIRAALYPAQNNYYYFVTDEAGNYYYASTLAEHDQNVAVAAQNGKVHGTAADTDAPEA